MKLINLTKCLFFLTNVLHVFSKTGFITYYNNRNITACGFDPDLYSDFAQVSISGVEWADSLACGVCLEINGTGNGEGATPFTGSYQAIVTNVCDVCEKDNFSVFGDGDGRWEIEYDYVPCNFDSIKYKLVDSNEYYIRLQVINTPYPITKLYINNKLATRTEDNYWTQKSHNPVYIFPMYIRFITIDDTEYYGLIYNKKIFTNFKNKISNLRKYTL